MVSKQYLCAKFVKDMKRISTTTVLLALVALMLTACSSDETYADKKEKERNAISNFVNGDVSIMQENEVALHIGKIEEISEEQFIAQDSTTDLERNQYVRFGNGVYMQIVRKGVGPKLEYGKSKRIIARYLEYNIMGDSIQSRNDILYYSTTPDIIDISNNYGTFTATFNTDNGGGAMYRYYNTTSVPAGWLIPFSYIHQRGRQDSVGTPDCPPLPGPQPGQPERLSLLLPDLVPADSRINCTP